MKSETLLNHAQKALKDQLYFDLISIALYTTLLFSYFY
jgi:hypothetical protein